MFGIGKKIKRARKAKGELDEARDAISGCIRNMSQLQICGGPDPLTLDNAERIILDCFDSFRQVQEAVAAVRKVF